MRLFISSGFTAPVLARIRDLQNYAGPLLGDSVKWVEPENIHLTYTFLGDVAQGSKLLAVKKSIDEAAGAFRKPRFALGGFGAFPSLERPRVLWLGLKNGGDALKAIALKLRSGLAAAGFILEHDFSAHITIARVCPAFLAREVKIMAFPDDGKRFPLSQTKRMNARLDSVSLARIAEKGLC